MTFRMNAATTWSDYAKCKGMPPSMFVPSGPGGSLAGVLRICNGEDGFPVCPVRLECGLAGDINDEIGVWGGRVRSTRRPRTVTPVTMIVDARPKRSDPT